MNREFRHFVKTLGQKLNTQFFFLNHGECGVFAECFTRHMHKLNLEARAVLVNYEYQDINISDICKQQMDFDDYNQIVSMVHIVVETSFGFVDSTGLYKTYGMSDGRFGNLVPGHYDLDYLSELNKCATNWNSRFDRSHIPDVQETISKHFEHHFPLSLCNENTFSSSTTA